MSLRGQSLREAVTLPQPAAKPPISFGRKALATFLLGFVILWVFAGVKALTGQAGEAAKGESACRAEMVCWAKMHKVAASDACQKAIEKLARYQAEWTHWAIDGIFKHAQWDNSAAGSLTYSGDSVKFQNGFGALLPHKYECDYDPELRLVTDVRAAPGRLN